MAMPGLIAQIAVPQSRVVALVLVHEKKVLHPLENILPFFPIASVRFSQDLSGLEVRDKPRGDEARQQGQPDAHNQDNQ